MTRDDRENDRATAGHELSEPASLHEDRCRVRRTPISQICCSQGQPCPAQVCDQIGGYGAPLPQRSSLPVAAQPEQPRRQAPAAPPTLAEADRPQTPHTGRDRDLSHKPTDPSPASAPHRPPLATSENSVVRPTSIMYLSCASPLGHI